MTDPLLFTLPLDKLIKVEQNLHLVWRYNCQLAGHVSVYEYGSREAATAAATEHLAYVHDVRPMSLIELHLAPFWASLPRRDDDTTPA